MLGLVGTLLYGLVCGGARLDDSINENNRRNNSVASGCPYYFDKNGIMRHSISGKKYTDQEIHNMFYAQPSQRLIEVRKKKIEIEKRWEEKYYVVKLGDSLNRVTHVFETEKEAIEFCKKNGEDVKVDSEKISDAMLENETLKFLNRYTLHFNKGDENVY